MNYDDDGDYAESDDDVDGDEDGNDDDVDDDDDYDDVLIFQNTAYMVSIAAMTKSTF